jgi:tetratricopeptide (TPR) repeat protein
MVLDSHNKKILDMIRLSTLQAEEFSKNAKVYPRPTKIFDATLSKYLAVKLKVDKRDKSTEETKFNNVTSIKHSSLKELSDLKPILLRDMSVNIIHYGRYLLCQTIEDPFYLTSLTTLVQDENDEIENVCLYNFSHDYNIEAKLLLPKHSILIIKEPYLISSMNNMDEFYIRIESPTDIMILTDMDIDDEIKKYLLEKWTANSQASKDDFSFEKLNLLGNKCFSEKNFYQAIRYYTQALNIAKLDSKVQKSDLKKTLNNRSLANLKLEKYFNAYKDALKSSEIKEEDKTVNDEKAFFRLGKAEYNMRQYVSASEWYQKCLKLNLENKEAIYELDKSKKRINESQKGEFDFKSIIETAKNQKQMRLDVADYVSDQIEVTSLNNDPSYKGFTH